jgi:hypothetical protein
MYRSFYISPPTEPEQHESHEDNKVHLAPLHSLHPPSQSPTRALSSAILSESDNIEEEKRYMRWNDYEIEPFLESYEKHCCTHKGKDLWRHIQQDLRQLGFRKSLWTLEKKWNNLLRRYRQVSDSRDFASYDAIQRILQTKKLQFKRSHSHRARETKDQAEGADAASGESEVALSAGREEEDPLICEAVELIKKLQESFEREAERRQQALDKLYNELRQIIRDYQYPD